MFACLALTLGAMFTSNWRQITGTVEQSLLNRSIPESMGLFSFACRMPGDTNSTSSGKFIDLTYCEEWWNNLQTWERIVSAAMVLAALIEAFAFVWNLFTWCACCCKQCLLHPLTLASLCAAISLATAVVVYGLNNQSAFQGVQNWDDIKDKISTEVGYSFWLACAALVLAVADTAVGTFAVCMGDSCV
ncbi:hypothetical protein RB195_021514 [Necator americanus]